MQVKAVLARIERAAAEGARDVDRRPDALECARYRRAAEVR
jgi:hypothetical protein